MDNSVKEVENASFADSPYADNLQFAGDNAAPSGDCVTKGQSAVAAAIDCAAVAAVIGGLDESGVGENVVGESGLYKNALNADKFHVNAENGNDKFGKSVSTQYETDKNAEENKNEQTGADAPKSSKFKNPEELSKAYGELEKEFTRRSQRLAKLEDELSKLQAPKQPSDEEWKQTVDKFFVETPAARPFAKEIAEVLVEHPELKESDRCLDAALTRVLVSKFRTPDEMLSDGQFLNDYVLSSPTVKRAVIESYVKGLKNGMPPEVMTDFGQPSVVQRNKPKTFEEAGALFAKNNK